MKEKEEVTIVIPPHPWGTVQDLQWKPEPADSAKPYMHWVGQ